MWLSLVLSNYGILVSTKEKKFSSWRYHKEWVIIAVYIALYVEIELAQILRRPQTLDSPSCFPEKQVV